MTHPCPCGTALTYQACCEPYILGKKQPSRCEELMRSRYSAYVKAEAAYLLHTHHPDFRHELTLDAIKEAAEQTDWVGLEVLQAKGDKTAVAGFVEFRAWYRTEQGLQCIYERSNFVKDAQQWLYTDGQFPGEYKLGRNDPCPCRSGKKYKKCCA